MYIVDVFFIYCWCENNINNICNVYTLCLLLFKTVRCKNT